MDDVLVWMHMSPTEMGKVEGSAFCICSSIHQVLSSERDTLVDLVHKLQEEYASATQRTVQQELELHAIKDSLLSSNSLCRNKLIVKGASNFHSMLRALRQVATLETRRVIRTLALLVVVLLFPFFLPPSSSTVCLCGPCLLGRT